MALTIDQHAGVLDRMDEMVLRSVRTGRPVHIIVLARAAVLRASAARTAAENAADGRRDPALTAALWAAEAAEEAAVAMMAALRAALRASFPHTNLATEAANARVSRHLCREAALWAGEELAAYYL